MLHSLASIKKLSLALGVAGIGVLAGLPALAQSGETPEFELSKEGFIILCDRTPLNSRCEGSPYYTGSSTQSPDENPEVSPSDTTAPTENLPSETDETEIEPSSGDGVLSPDGMMQDGSPSSTDGSSPDGSMVDPSGTTAPTENLPSETDETETPSSSGGMQGGSMSSPSNTSAPTQTLPSETDGK